MSHRRRHHHGHERPILVVTGMSREAACLSPHGVDALCSGADARFLRSALHDKARNQYGAVVSFGLAGGLCPSLRPGDAVIGARVVGETGAIETHAHFSDVLHQGLGDAGVKTQKGAIAGVDAPAMTAARKSELRRSSNAIAVDMESHIAGAFAEAQGLPFAIVRVACDPAERALPPLASRAIAPNGGVDLALVLRELAREPRQLMDLIRAGVDSSAAFATLGRCGGLLGPLFGLVRA
ncbi:MAG TPA: phosphorylase [Methylocystis sp.]|nr:phosphorylase [Methylocystis sp.]